ncbi:germination protein GerKB [Brevibacillus reuszeri]|uniref:Germination protein GerKB n=2 Tax=Brevibacillus reuszeri TaxID=54915 RepID=A0ABQ0TQB1_9BACL|nr:endospore germination permease [Brevibacillus reuszeri]MED1861429.1 endospore germination permease [Brevibacillus reuszeri]GED69974.1 germination protein GerKB [Brevibacillus reuszeri]
MEKGRISVRQVVVLTFMFTLGDMLQLFPSIVSSDSQQDGWISAVIVMIAGVFVTAIILTTFQFAPGLTLIQSCLHAFGNVLGFVISIWYLFFLLIDCSYLVREIGGFMTTSIFITTPLPFVNLLIILLMLWAFKAGLEAMGRSAEILLPLLLIAITILIVSLLPQMNIHHFKPVGENGIVPILKSSLLGTAFSFGELFAFLMIFPYVKLGSNMNKEVLFGSFAAGLIFSIITAMCIGVIGPKLTAFSTYPMYTLAQKVNLGNFFQRIEAIMALAYLITTFFKALVVYYAFITGTVQLFRLKDRRSLFLPSGVLIFGLAVIIAPDVTYYLVELVTPWMFWDLTNGILIPLFLCLIYSIKQRMVKSEVQK